MTNNLLSPRNILMSLIGLYLLALAIYWIWLLPSLVDQRISSRIKSGMTGAQIANVLGIHEPFDAVSATYCAPASIEKFSRISIYNSGSVPLLPLPMVIATTTTFCFDTQDKLIAIRTKRWIDGP